MGRKKTKEITLMGPRMDYGVIGIKTATRVMNEIGTKESPMVQSLSGMEMDKDLLNKTLKMGNMMGFLSGGMRMDR